MTEASQDPLPVAAVLVDTPLAHLDREFEYAVPAQLADLAVPGSRVRVPFAGRDLEGFVLRRLTAASHPGPLRQLRSVVSPEPVLLRPVLDVITEVARRYGGTRSDVVRLAIPKRHAAAERALTERPPADPGPVPEPAADAGPWRNYPAGPSFLRRMVAGQGPAASWLALPGQPADRDWPMALAVAAHAALRADRGVLIVVPDHRDVTRVDTALRSVLGTGRHVRLTADQGPQARYTAWLTLLRGHVRCVVGTRAAAFAPVADLGLAIWWDDGDDLHDEPRAPYPQVGEVLRARAQIEGCALLAGGFARSVAQQQAIESGQDRPISAESAHIRRSAPRIVVADEDDQVRDGAAALARLPTRAWRVATQALAAGPVLVQVPRRGYLPSLRCQECRSPVRCHRCHGPMSLTAADGAPRCDWCGAGLPATGFSCPTCSGRMLRAGRVGERRTAEELGRAFPGVPVVTSSAGAVVASVRSSPALIVATPGAEPLAEGGYVATVLLDAWAMLDRPGLDAGVEALRRWMTAAALTRGHEHGGQVVLCGVTGPHAPPVAALVRWDPAWLAARELAERRDLGLPPAVTMARLRGDRSAVAAALAAMSADLGDAVVGPVLGPVPARSERSRRADGSAELVEAIVRVAPRAAPELAAAARAARVVRSAHKAADPLQIRLGGTGL